MKLPLAILTALSLSLRCWSAETRLLECPVSLTNPDGQALDLERCDVRTAVHGPLALVEMEMTFRNPQPRQMEGRFLYLLPPGATVSRFAKEVDGKLMEGEVVERMRAQRIFTEILHTMRDPALLEQDQGNRFAGLKDPYQATVIRAGNYQMTAYRPETAVIGKAEPMGWCFYIDTSASGADMEQRRLDAINHLYPKTLTDKGTTRVWAYDLDVVPVLSQAANQNWIPEGYIPPEKGLQQFLRTRHCLGATNLEAALKHIGDQARCAERPTRFVLVSDGIATFGAREPRELIAALGEWPEQHVLHALVLGPKQDAKTLSAIVEKTNGRVVTVSLGSDMEKSVERAVVELQRPVGASFEFYDEGAEWIFPKSFRDVGPGDEMVLFSRVKDGAAAKPGVIQRNALGNVVKDQPLTAPPREAPAFAPLFEREACAAYLNHLEKLEQETVDQAKIAELRKQRIDVSVKHRVLCPLTSLLVLETEQDYARFGIDRKALADVMVVGNKGIELRHRTAEDQPVVQVARPRERAGAARRELAEETEAAANKPAETAKEESETLAISGAVNFAQSDDARDDSGGGGQSGDLEVVRSDRAATTTTDFSAPSIQAPSTPAPLGETRVAEPAPVATPPVMPPLRRPEQQQTQETARPVVQQPGWTAQYQAVPKDDELNALRAQVAAAPRERRLRNTYANALLKKQDWDGLQALAFEWLPFDSENPQVYEFLGKSATGLKDLKTALRAFTSIAEIAPNRAALLARAGWLLLIADQHEMAAQMFREALKNRDDDPNIYRGLALACWLKGDFVGTADTLEGALKQKFNERYGDARRVLSEELGYVYRAWLKAVQTQADDTHARVSKRAESVGVKLKRVDAIRVTLGWETDANDVDLHVVDPAGEECFYSHKNNKSGLELYSDQTQGLGPEVIRCSKAQTGVYHVGVNYFAAGPMGVSRGVVVILQPDAEGLVERPQIVPFCLAEGGADMRHLAAVVVP